MRLAISEHQQGESPCSHAHVRFWHLIGFPAAMLHNDVRRQQLIEQMGWSSTRVHSIRAVIMEPAAVFISDISHPWLIMSALHWLIIHSARIKKSAVVISVLLCGCEESGVSWGGTDPWSVELDDKDLIHTVHPETYCWSLLLCIGGNMIFSDMNTGTNSPKVHPPNGTRFYTYQASI